MKKITSDWLRGKIPNCEAEALFIAPDDRNIPCLARLHLPLDRDMVLETMCSGTYRQLFSMVCNARERMFPGSVEIVPRKRDVLPPVGFPVAFHITEKSAGQEWNSLGAFVLSERIGAIQHVVTDDGGLSGSAANVSTRGIGTITEANIRFSVVAMPKHCHPVPRMAARVGYQALFFGGFPPDLRGGEALYVGLHALPEGKERPTAFGCFAEQIVSPKGLDQPISQKA